MLSQLSIDLTTGDLLPDVCERRALRERAELRLVDLAAILRADISTISRWERGCVEPRGSARVLYAAVLEQLQRSTYNDDTPPGGTSGASFKTDLGGLDAPGY